MDRLQKSIGIMIMVLCTIFLLQENTYSAGEEWLTSHNNYRTLHGVPSVAWSSTVASSAQAYANTCPTGHSSSGYGENIAYASYTQTPQNVVTRWYDEETLYDYNNPGFSPATGHFTQVVWKSTTQIGCGCKDDCGGTWKTICVCQYNPPGNYTGQFAYNVFPPTAVPGIPSLTSPSNGATVDGTGVTFSWNTPSGSPTKYHIQISIISTFTTTVYNNDNRTGNSVALAGFPNNGTTYYWRVRAFNSAGWGSWSVIRSLINGPVPPAPTLVSPVNHAKLEGTSVTFRWNSSARATKYFLAVNTSPTFSESTMFYYGNAGDKLSQTLSLPKDGKQYYWMVCAGNDVGWGPWSYYRVLTTPSSTITPILQLLLE